VQGQQKFIYHLRIGKHKRRKLCVARYIGIPSKSSQMPICDLIVDGAFKCFIVYEHGSVGSVWKENKKTIVSRKKLRPIYYHYVFYIHKTIDTRKTIDT